MADNAIYEDLALGVVNEGRSAIKDYVDETERFSADYRFEVVSEQASTDRYAFEWVMLGTHTGETRGLPATNKPYRIRGVSVGRRASDGRVQENRDYWNLADFLGQLGLFGPPGTRLTTSGTPGPGRALQRRGHPASAWGRRIRGERRPSTEDSLLVRRRRRCRRGSGPLHRRGVRAVLLHAVNVSRIGPVAS